MLANVLGEAVAEAISERLKPLREQIAVLRGEQELLRVLVRGNIMPIRGRDVA